MRLLGEKKGLLFLKSRQIGLSWVLCIYALWKAKFFENVKVLFLSQGEEEAYDLISRCKFIDDNLPVFLKARRDPDQRGFVGFPDTGSELKALPSTERAGRSTDATVVICDEWEFHPYAEQNFGALKPTIDAGGQFIGLSTADKTKLNTFFKKKYHEAKAGFSSFHKEFFGWRVRPGRTQEWFDEVTRDLADWQREQEYPDTEEEALGVLKTRRYFSEDALLQMPIKYPLEHELSDKYKGVVRIYKVPITGRKYVIFTDPSEGVEDPHATIVRDHNSGEWVAISHGMTTADECARIHDDLVRLYNGAWNSFELNNRAGGIMDEKIKALATPSQCPFVDANGTLNTKGKYGWWTSKTLKEKMRLTLEENVRTQAETIYDKDARDELLNYIQPEGQDPCAPAGGHDDFIMAAGGCLVIDKYMPVGAGRVRTVRAVERW